MFKVSIYIFKDLPIIIGTRATIDLIKKPFSKSEFDNSKYKFFLKCQCNIISGKILSCWRDRNNCIFNDKC